MTTHVSDATFGEEVLNSKEPVLVDFWAEWCGPCRAISPLLEELSSELAGKVKIVKLNVDENPVTMTKYGVRSIPTMILFKDGEAADMKIGAGTPKAGSRQVAAEPRARGPRRLIFQDTQFKAPPAYGGAFIIGAPATPQAMTRG